MAQFISVRLASRKPLALLEWSVSPNTTRLRKARLSHSQKIFLLGIWWRYRVDSMMLSLWLSVTFLVLFFLLVLAVLLWWSHRQSIQNQIFLTLLKETQESSLAEATKVSLGSLELLNKSLTLLSTKDPLAYQAVAAMEVPSSFDAYYAQDDESEAKRHNELTETGDNEPDFDPAIWDNGAEFGLDPIS